MRNDNIEMLQDTLRILKQGSYKIDGKTIDLKLSKKAMETIHVLLPENVRDICDRTELKNIYTVIGRCGHGCENTDSFTAARQQYKKFSYMFWKEDAKPVLVLNLANPVHPGGGSDDHAGQGRDERRRVSEHGLSQDHGDAKMCRLFWIQESCSWCVGMRSFRQ